MSEYQDPYGPAALYADIQHDKIQVEPDLKEEILGAFERVGTFRDKRGYFWRSEDPRVVLDELIAAVQQNLDTKHDQDGDVLDEETLNDTRRVYVRLYRVRRALKNILKHLENES